MALRNPLRSWAPRGGQPTHRLVTGWPRVAGNSEGKPVWTRSECRPPSWKRSRCQEAKNAMWTLAEEAAGEGGVPDELVVQTRRSPKVGRRLGPEEGSARTPPEEAARAAPEEAARAAGPAEGSQRKGPKEVWARGPGLRVLQVQEEDPVTMSFVRSVMNDPGQDQHRTVFIVESTPVRSGVAGSQVGLGAWSATGRCPVSPHG